MQMLQDDRDHNATAVHKFIEAIMRFLKTIFLVKHVHYFSDIYSQYKNYCSLCFHAADHQVTAAWNFFLLPVMSKAHVMESVVQ